MNAFYEIVAPNSKPYAASETWAEACETAIELSLKWGILFQVRRVTETDEPFRRERLQLLELAMNYVELARNWPKSISAEKARARYETAKSKLDTLMQVHSEFEGSDFAERAALAHPIKAIRTTDL